MGNPPFVGAKFQSEFQRAQMRRIARLGGSGGTLDYVAAWFVKAAEYLALPPKFNDITANSEQRTANSEQRKEKSEQLRVNEDKDNGSAQSTTKEYKYS